MCINFSRVDINCSRVLLTSLVLKIACIYLLLININVESSLIKEELD